MKAVSSVHRQNTLAWCWPRQRVWREVGTSSTVRMLMFQKFSPFSCLGKIKLVWNSSSVMETRGASLRHYIDLMCFMWFPLRSPASSPYFSAFSPQCWCSWAWWCPCCPWTAGPEGWRKDKWLFFLLLLIICIRLILLFQSISCSSWFSSLVSNPRLG